MGTDDQNLRSQVAARPVQKAVQQADDAKVHNCGISAASASARIGSTETQNRASRGINSLVDRPHRLVMIQITSS
jgi:alpha-D-ribose 1-methylphosphonate 5-triphosphate diphosphatase PhnM